MVKVRVSKIGRPFKNPDVDKAVLKQLEKESKTILGLFKRTTTTWKKRPEFESKIVGKYSLVVGTDNQIYNWISSGTRKNYPIPKNPLPYPLRFNSKFTPKTRVRTLKSYRGSSSPPVVRPMQVTHPGIKPREFQEKINDSYDKRFKKNLDNAIKKALKGKT